MAQLFEQDSAVRYLSPAGVANLTGLALVTVRRYIRRGWLPAIQPGGYRHRLLVPTSALEALLGAEVIDSGVDSTTNAPKALENCERQVPEKLPGAKPKWMRHRHQH